MPFLFKKYFSCLVTSFEPHKNKPCERVLALLHTSMDESQIIMWGERRQTKEAHTYHSTYTALICKSVSSGKKQTTWFAWEEVGNPPWGGQRERTNGHKDTFGGDGYAHSLGCTNGFVGVNV